MKPKLILRSLLAVPATSPHFLEKARQGPADAVFIDLDDAVFHR
jgi:malyl-CoA/(S)-citramalyl-CoA lyase